MSNDMTTMLSSQSEFEFSFSTPSVLVTEQAMGARCAVAADLNGDGRMDLVSASSNDNAVSWYENLGNSPETKRPTFSIKNEITWSSLGSRIVTVADIDGDGDVDVIGASYYDSSLRWFENINGTGTFTEHLISSAVNEGQGVTVADIDNDGDADIITASSGDHSIAIFYNMGHSFCQIKHTVDHQAMGARTVVAADLNGDGWLDLASASKDDDTVAWYPNDGTGHFYQKHIISVGEESTGAYSLVAVDIDNDGDQDLIVASNGNDHVSLWRNTDGNGTFVKTLIYDQADFVLSVTAVDFDRDGDLDVASASFFDGYINWYENLDGSGYEWRHHVIHVGLQGHYVSYGDMDGDGDDDLIAVTHADNTVAIFLAHTACDTTDPDSTIKQECCHSGTEWNGTACEPCPMGTYGTGSGMQATCVACPVDTCIIPGWAVVPATCSGITGCAHPEEEVAACTCPAHTVKSPETDACVACPQGQVRPDRHHHRDISTMDNYTAWELQQGICHVQYINDWRTPVSVAMAVAGLVLLGFMSLVWRRQSALAKADAMWTIDPKEIIHDDPVQVLGTGSFGQVWKATYRGTAVAVKSALPAGKVMGTTNNSIISSTFSFSSKAAVMGDVGGGGGGGDVDGEKSLAQAVDGTSSWGHLGHLGSATFKPADQSTVSMEMAPTPTTKSVAAGGTKSLVAAAAATTTSNYNTTQFKRTSTRILRKAFVEEMRILSRLRHPCITTVMGAVLPTSGKPLLVMEFMEHGSLRDLLSNQTFPLDPEQTLPLIRDIMQGVRFLHATDPPIIHGDLKCANVLVDVNFRAKIADFGLSARHNAGHQVGTPFWMAPEILRGGSITTQSDVYSFGVLLWEVMTHKIPYQDLLLPLNQILRNIQEGTLRPDCHDGLDQELVDCMRECWDQQPEKRPTLQDLEMKIIPLCGQNFYSVMQERRKVTNQQSDLLRDVFPEHIANALIAGKKVEPEHHDCVTICFSDIVGFTTLSSVLQPKEVSDLLDRLYTQFDELSHKHGVFKLETIGDAWVGVTNLTQSQEDHAARMAHFCIDALHAAEKTPVHKDRPDLGVVNLRIGFHSGPVVSNVIGTRNPRYCLFGDSMNVASRMESSSEAGRIQCSEAAAHLAQKQAVGLKFVRRGKIQIKGKGVMRTCWCYEANGAGDPTSSENEAARVRFDVSENDHSHGNLSISTSPDLSDASHELEAPPLSSTAKQLQDWLNKRYANDERTTAIDV